MEFIPCHSLKSRFVFGSSPSYKLTKKGTLAFCQFVNSTAGESLFSGKRTAYPQIREKIISNHLSYTALVKNQPFILANLIHPNSYPIAYPGYLIELRQGYNRVTMPIHEY